MPAVCVPLYKIIARNDGQERYNDSEAVAEAFRFNSGTPLILTGIGNDHPLEQWWSRSSDRLPEIRRLKDLGVVLVTTPNFSLFTDRPRWDDMHSMKRIAIVHEEFLREGLPAALHLNARTDHDWKRWTEYVSQRNEVTHVAFEFTTGAGRADRIDWYIAQLEELVQNVSRPLHLVVRGASNNVLRRLASAIGKITVLDTTPFMKAVKRQKAVETGTGHIEWESSPTLPDEPIDELLAHNCFFVCRSTEAAMAMYPYQYAAE